MDSVPVGFGEFTSKGSDQELIAAVCDFEDLPFFWAFFGAFLELLGVFLL